MAKKINKSSSHCKALIGHANKVLKELAAMRATMAGDQTANAGEREADIALVDRWVATFQKANAWWTADIARNEEEANRVKTAPEQVETKA